MQTRRPRSAVTTHPTSDAACETVFPVTARLPSASLPSGACDCHIHVYDHRFPKVPDARLDPPDASVEDYRRLQRRLGLARAVVVTPSTYGSDNRLMLEALQALGADGRGVAVIDGTERMVDLVALDAQGVRGVRLNLSLSKAATVDAILPLARRIADLGWHLQLLMAPEVLGTLGPLLRQVPVPLVFDHFGRIPPARARDLHAHALLLELLSQGRAWVKLSGGYIVSALRTTADPALGPLAAAYLDAAPERVLWGSDWPHATASAGRHPMPDDDQQLDCLAAWTGNPALFHRVLVTNPQALYAFPPAEQKQS